MFKITNGKLTDKMMNAKMMKDLYKIKNEVYNVFVILDQNVYILKILHFWKFKKLQISENYS